MDESPARVLVVDDEKPFREAIQEALAGAGIGCALAEHGAEALERATLPQLGAVVVDLGMPGMDGLAVLRRLRQVRPLLRVIVLSTQAEQDAVLEALRLGACDYLAKPLHEEELILSVQRALEGHEIASRWEGMRSCLQALNEKLSRLGEETASVDGARRRALASEEGARAVAAILRASRSSVMLLDDEAGVLRVAAAVGAPLPPAEMDAVASGESVAGRVFASGETLLVYDVRQDSRIESSAPPDRYASPSFVVAPLGSGLERTGVLCASEPADGRPFDEDSRVLLEILGHQLGRLLAAQAAPVLDLEGDLEGELPEVAVLESTPDAQGPDEEAASRDVELARAVCAAITSEVTPERILADALAAASAALGDAPTSIHLLDGASGELRLEAQRDGGERSDRPQLPADRGLTGTVVATRQPMAVDHPQQEARFDPEVDTPEDAEPGPLVCVPLCFRNKTLGVFRGFPRQTGRATARTAEILAASLSAAARNVLLYRGLVDSIEEVARVRREAAKRPGIGGRPKAGR